MYGICICTYGFVLGFYVSHQKKKVMKTRTISIGFCHTSSRKVLGTASHDLFSAATKKQQVITLQHSITVTAVEIRYLSVFRLLSVDLNYLFIYSNNYCDHTSSLVILMAG